MDLGIHGKILFWILSISIFLYEVYQILLGKSSKSWKSHPAKVIEVKIETRTDEGTEESSPKIKYQYRYMGASYIGNKVKYGDLWSTNYRSSNDLLRGVVKGRDVNIYVNPNRPNQSVLHRGYEGNILWFLVFFCVFFAIAFKS
ncbi:DUF3592 domain-containing protein [Simiduia aestuariiviva]|uniref:DUF3592 domain-containing protein n=1 Tax=Simiduia aestuariiviva TaxID=1510459 RepID=A0A839UMT9_9GAMM|nr:hypothetical protein [Simiduia aestuariiviva]